MHPEDPEAAPSGASGSGEVLPADPLRKRERWEQPSADGTPGVDVGGFEQGSDFSRWALARYLVGKAIADSVTTTLLAIAVVLLVLAGLSEWGLHSTLLAVFLVVLAVGVLLLRWVLVALLRRLVLADRYGPIAQRLEDLIDATQGDVLREMRRVGLPGHTITLPLVAIRLIGKRRDQTLARLREFRVENAVPRARVDELHMMLRGQLGDPGAGPSGRR